MEFLKRDFGSLKAETNKIENGWIVAVSNDTMVVAMYDFDDAFLLTDWVALMEQVKASSEDLNVLKNIN